MIDTDTKVDELHSSRRTRPESKDEMAAMQRVYPPDLPATHIWDYRWEQPTPEQLAQNRYRLPELVRGPRELTLSEVAAKTKDFETLGHGELRWLFDHHKVKALPVDATNTKLSEVDALRGAIRAHAKTDSTPPAKPAVQAQKSPTADPVVLPADIAGMDGPTIDTQAVVNGWGEEYKKISGKPLPIRRAWLATKRAEKKELVTT